MLAAKGTGVDDRYFVSASSISTVGKPSAALAQKIEKDEKDRLEKRKAELGEAKLKELEKLVEDAKKESEIPPPPEMLSNFPITDVSLYSVLAQVSNQVTLLTPALDSHLGPCRDCCRQRPGADH